MSAAKAQDAIKYSATHMNMKLPPDQLKTRKGRENVLRLVKTLFDNDGYHIQFNVLDTNILRDAQKHPENYRDLVVRVAGFSAFFTKLAPGVQNEVIERTLHRSTASRTEVTKPVRRGATRAGAAEERQNPTDGRPTHFKGGICLKKRPGASWRIDHGRRRHAGNAAAARRSRPLVGNGRHPLRIRRPAGPGDTRRRSVTSTRGGEPDLGAAGSSAPQHVPG
jgi:hypothetical protein